MPSLAALAAVGWPSTARVTAGDPRNPWFSAEYLRQNHEALLGALGEHVRLTVIAVLIAVVIAIPFAVLAFKVDWLTGPILALSGALYTIPSLALFAFLAPYMGVERPTPVVVGLVLYALLIVLRGGLTGLRQVPDEVREAARGMGYGPAAMIWRVELPLALPSMLTGVRVATVSTVALVTVGEIMGFGGLGNLIMSGFRNNFYKPQIMAATLACIGLALVLDLLLMMAGRLATPWTRGRRAAT